MVRDVPRPGRTRRRWRSVARIATGVIAVYAVMLAVAGYFDRDSVRVFPGEGRKADVAALYFSGDMGLHLGIALTAREALVAHGIDVMGVSMPTLFVTRRSRAATDAIVIDAVRRGLAFAGQRKLVLIGQSYGADILQTGLAALPSGLRTRIGAVILIVPGNAAFFRADPSSIAYRGTPDSLGAQTIAALTWAPVTCIYGLSEQDSLCPDIRVPGATIVGMPGGHFLERDSAGVNTHILDAIAAAVPSLGRAK